MQNNYIKVKMNRANEIRTTADLTILGDTYFNVDVKIDTGCSRTLFPTSKLGISNFKASRLKAKAIADKNVEKTVGFGVNDTNEDKKHAKEEFNKGNFGNIRSVSFTHKIEDLFIDNVPIKAEKVRVNYDGDGNILIGMDILKDWDIHIGTIVTGETIFLACPKYMINDEYLCELEKTFHVGTEVCSAIAREKV